MKKRIEIFLQEVGYGEIRSWNNIREVIIFYKEFE